MSFATVAGGAAAGGAPCDHHPSPARRACAGLSPTDDRGSQTLEFALVLPAVGFVLLAVLATGMLAAEVVVTHSVAREAARVAAVADDAAVRAAAAAAAGGRDVDVVLTPPAGARAPGDLVTATVRVRSRSLARIGPGVWLPAEATMRVEDR